MQQTALKQRRLNGGPISAALTQHWPDVTSAARVDVDAISQSTCLIGQNQSCTRRNHFSERDIRRVNVGAAFTDARRASSQRLMFVTDYSAPLS